MFLKKYIFNDKNLFLVVILLGIIFPQAANYIKPYAIWILAVVMALSLTGLQKDATRTVSKLLNPIFTGIMLNHIAFGIFMIIAAYIFIGDLNIFYGFIIIAASPPGVAIIPLTDKLNGNIEYSTIATVAAILASIILTPLIIAYYSQSMSVGSIKIIYILVVLVIFPFLVSRILLIKKIKPFVSSIKNEGVDIGFAIVIYYSIAVNSNVFFTEPMLLFYIAICFLVIFFGGSYLLGKFINKNNNSEQLISSQLLFTIKNHGFAVITAIELFGNKASIPATVMDITILFYLLYQLQFVSPKNS